MLRALRNPLDARPALAAGLAAGFGLWLSVEFLLVVGLCLGALGLPWLLGERERAAQSKFYAFGMSAILLVALFVERRSEEHTSELQSLMRISYAVFCLKQKNTKDRHKYVLTTRMQIQSYT